MEDSPSGRRLYGHEKRSATNANIDAKTHDIRFDQRANSRTPASIGHIRYTSYLDGG